MASAPQPPAGTPGHTGWHELRASEWQSAFAFYSGLFGWTKDQAVDMGEMGTYQTFAADGVQIGGMMTKSAEMPKPHWLYYFNVAEIKAAAARVRDAAGGSWGDRTRFPVEAGSCTAPIRRRDVCPGRTEGLIGFTWR